MSIRCPPDLLLALCEEAECKSMQKCEQISDLGITVNSAFNPSANVLTVANKVRGSCTKTWWVS